MPNQRPADKIRKIYFNNRRLNALGIELLSLDDIRGKLSAEDYARPERVDFELLMLVTSGQGIHTVDFTDWQVSSGSLVIVRPGQVQQWHPDQRFTAELILIDPTALPGAVPLISSREATLYKQLEWRTCSTLDPTMRKEFSNTFRLLKDDIHRFDNSDLEQALCRHQLQTLLLRLARWQRDLSAPIVTHQQGYKTYHLFIALLEQHFSRQHSLKFYATKLGYSESTINRACHAAKGQSAKQVIDARILLEAKRLLVHCEVSVAELAHSLGFSEATNFIKFFRRLTGTTPLLFSRQRSFRQAAHKITAH
ncbi:AraC family transcriptional regulator [Amphritea sp.]|uniref:AraC family transcriptional regulator n=1 Tax=Amphritea sp. TaxID=1872502 RepID=UPI003D1449CB